MRSFYHNIFLILLSFLFLSCSEAPSPTDNELIDIFKANESAFNNLVSSPDNSELSARLGIKSMHIRSTKPKVVHFVFWHKDYFGPGGASKGIAYLEEVPTSLETFLVSHIDNNREVGPPNQGDFYMRINDHWYVYYVSYD